MITFAIFHVPVPQDTNELIRQMHAFDRTGISHETLLDLVFRSALLFHPDCRLILMTSRDYNPQFSQRVQQRLEFMRADVDTTALLQSRAAMERQIIQCHDYQSHIVMMDGDILVNDNLEKLFGEEFDLALTYRTKDTPKQAAMPINGGIKMVHQRGQRAATAFYDKVYSFYTDQTETEMKAWWGDQTSIISAIGMDNFKQRTSDDMVVDSSIKIKLLPCEQYNFTPTKRPYKIWKKLTDKKILHFKGGRKKMMLHYWNLYLAICEQRSRATKRAAMKTRAKLMAEILMREKY